MSSKKNAKNMTVRDMANAALDAGARVRIELAKEGDGKLIEFTTGELFALRDRAVQIANICSKAGQIIAMREWFTLACSAEHLALMAHAAAPKPEYTLAVRMKKKAAKIARSPRDEKGGS